MRIWLNPARLDSYGLTVSDVSQAISTQNIQVSSGEVGAVPSTKGQRLDATVIGPTRFTTPEQFDRILLKVNMDGSQVRLKDVATVELGSQTYEPSGRYNGNDSAAIGINLAPGANQLQVAQAIKAELQALQVYFPYGLEAVFPYDTTPVVILSLAARPVWFIGSSR
jgi:multidrug efflux pump